MLILVPFAVIVAAMGLFAALLRRPGPAPNRAAGDDPGWEQLPHRPLWGNPLVWLGVGVVFSLLGLFVTPRLFGAAFLFLPIVWIRGARRSRKRR